MSKKRSAARNHAEYLALRTASVFISLLPERLAWYVGKLLGKVLLIVDRRHRAVARLNLSAAFPEKTPDDVSALAKKVFEHLGLLIVESFRFPRMLAQGIERFVETPDVSELRPVLDEGKGVIVATAHMGNWEVAGHACSALVVPLSSVARPLDNPLLEKHLDGSRRLSGQKIIAKKGAVRGMVRELKAGRSVAVLLDQDARRHGIFVDFFNRPASTWPTAAALSLKLGCPIVFGFARRLGGRFRHKLILDQVFRPEPTSDRQADIHNLTQRITSRMEARIRECPEQWFWVHRRWKTQPPAKS